jgi:hypothetical protein
VHEEDFPVKFRPIISRLQQAVEVQEIRDNMDMEDTILEEFEILERRAMDAERKIEEADRQVAAANQQAAALLQGNIAAARMMKASGLNEEDICRFLQINAEKLQEWLTLDEQ